MFHEDTDFTINVVDNDDNDIDVTSPEGSG